MSVVLYNAKVSVSDNAQSDSPVLSKKTVLVSYGKNGKRRKHKGLRKKRGVTPGLSSSTNFRIYSCVETGLHAADRIAKEATD
jgi:hypothetical protein